MGRDGGPCPAPLPCPGRDVETRRSDLLRLAALAARPWDSLETSSTLAMVRRPRADQQNKGRQTIFQHTYSAHGLDLFPSFFPSAVSEQPPQWTTRPRKILSIGIYLPRTSCISHLASCILHRHPLPSVAVTVSPPSSPAGRKSKHLPRKKKGKRGKKQGARSKEEHPSSCNPSLLGMQPPWPAPAMTTFQRE